MSNDWLLFPILLKYKTGYFALIGVLINLFICFVSSLVKNRCEALGHWSSHLPTDIDGKSDSQEENVWTVSWESQYPRIIG